MKSVYQNGDFVEVVSAGDKNPLWMESKKVVKQFDKQLKGFVLVLESLNSKLQASSGEKLLGLSQGFLLMQVFIYPNQPFSVELGFVDTHGTKRRLLFSSCTKDLTIHPLHARAPNTNFPRSTWTNLCFDLQKWSSACFFTTFRALDSISVSAVCKIRKIFTLKTGIQENSLESMAKGLEFPLGVNFVNQVVVPDSVLSLVNAENMKSSKKGMKRPPINTAPLENIKRLNLFPMIVPQGKTATTFFVKKPQEGGKVKPVVTQRQNMRKKPSSIMSRRHSVGGNDEKQPEIEKNLNVLDVKESLENKTEEFRLNDFQYNTNYRNSEETMSNSIEEEIEIESCQLEDPQSEHNFFPQAKPEPMYKPPTFFTTGLTQATQHRPFTPPFTVLSSSKSIQDPSEFIFPQKPSIHTPLLTLKTLCKPLLHP